MAGKVFLIDSGIDYHIDKKPEGNEFTDEMARWPMYFKRADHISDEVYNGHLRLRKNIIEALLRLDGFTSFFPARVDWLKNQIELISKESLIIFREDYLILNSGVWDEWGENGYPIETWPLFEDGCPEKEIRDKVWEIREWSVEQWYGFIRQQLLKSAENKFKSVQAQKLVLNKEISNLQDILQDMGEPMLAKPPYLFALECIESVYDTSLRDIAWLPLRDIGVKSLGVLRRLHKTGKIPVGELPEIKERLRRIAGNSKVSDSLSVLIQDFIELAKESQT